MAGSTQTAGSTRERLIITAERLFAERGISAVSLREVGTAAGQRNTSATQYHFGDKDTLVRAIFEYRMTSINEHRLQLLAQMQATGQSADLRSLLEAFIYPLAAIAADADSHYGAFLAQLISDPHHRVGWDWEEASSLRLVWLGIRRCLAHLPEHVVDERQQMLGHLVVHTVADHERHGDTPAGDPQPAWATRLVDAAHGLLGAPDSASS